MLTELFDCCLGFAGPKAKALLLFLEYGVTIETTSPIVM